MELSVSRDLDKGKRHDMELDAQLAAGGLRYAAFEGPLELVREACSHALLTDYTAANGRNAEDRMWDSHQKVNAHYRRLFIELKKSTEKKTIELRKAGSEYLRFLKSAQRFYRSFVGQLAQTYGGIPALERAARQFQTNTNVRQGTAVPVRPATAELEQCCHRTLIHLGDLSRYRETEGLGKDKEKDWAPAIGYYELAHSVCPGSGQPFNQQAIISLVERSYFRATYYTYRALCAEVPHPQAQQNLRKVIGMTQKAWDSGELVREPKATVGAALPGSIGAFVLKLIDLSLTVSEPTKRDELEREISTQLQTHLSRPVELQPPTKLILIVISAQYSAQKRFEEKPRVAYYLMVALNVRIFTAIVQVVLKRFEAQDEGSLDPVITRSMPAMRIYSAWLFKNHEFLSPQLIQPAVVNKFWGTFAECLNRLNAAFPAGQAEALNYLLEEDEETLGFVPLQSPENAKVWYAGDALRPRWRDMTDQRRDKAKETLYRIREVLLDALRIAILPDQTLFVFDTASGSFAAGAADGNSEDVQVPASRPAPPAAPSRADSEDADAERMVDSIVGIADEAADDARNARGTTGHILGTHSHGSPSLADPMTLSRSSIESHLHSPPLPQHPQRLPSHDSDHSGRSQAYGFKAWDALRQSPTQPPRQSPSLAVRSIRAPAHSRGASAEASPSIWSPAPSSPGQSPTLAAPAALPMSRTPSYRTLNLGNGTFGREAAGGGTGAGGGDWGGAFGSALQSIWTAPTPAATGPYTYTGTTGTPRSPAPGLAAGPSPGHSPYDSPSRLDATARPFRSSRLASRDTAQRTS